MHSAANIWLLFGVVDDDDDDIGEADDGGGDDVAVALPLVAPMVDELIRYR